MKEDYWIYNTSRIEFEITQKDPRLLYKIKKNLGFGSVYSVVQNEKIYYRYYVGKKENILRLISLLNGNLILTKRQKQFETLINNANKIWNLNLRLKAWTAKITLIDPWICGFVEGDGCFSTNQANNFKRGKYENGSIRYGYLIKFTITQFNEDATLLQIRDLFQATTKISHFQNHPTSNTYSQLSINCAKSRELIIQYFTKFPMLGKTKISYLRWKRIHFCQQNKKYLTEKSAKRLKKVLDKLSNRDLCFYETFIEP